VAIQLAAFFELCIEIDAERIIIYGDLSGLTLENTSPDMVFAVVGSCAEFLKATERLGEAQRSYYGNFAALLKKLPPEYQVAAFEMLEEDMLDKPREEEDSFYLEVLSILETALSPQVAELV
jgi:hypothetical protein